MVELVWDRQRQGTAWTPSGASLCVGDNANFSPDELVGFAAASCLMKTFLQLAAEEDLTGVSFLSTADVITPPDGDAPAHVRLRVFLSAERDADRRRLEELLTRAADHSPIARLLRDRFDLQADIRVLATNSDGQ